MLRAKRKSSILLLSATKGVSLCGKTMGCGPVELDSSSRLLTYVLVAHSVERLSEEQEVVGA